MKKQQQQCDGKAGCSCADCRAWDADDRRPYGYQKWLKETSRG
jgi:hypothetical protein